VSTNSDYQLVVTTVNSVMVERYIDFDMSWFNLQTLTTMLPFFKAPFSKARMYFLELFKNNTSLLLPYSTGDTKDANNVSRVK
jgi:hypothetical protein